MSRSHILAGPLLAAIGLGAPLTTAHAEVPTRIANHYDWNSYDDSLASVRSAEQQAGIALAPPQQRATTDQVESLYQQLEGNQNASPNSGLGNSNP